MAPTGLLELPQLTFCRGLYVRHLHLDQVFYDFAPGPACTLPGLTHLSISNLLANESSDVGILGSAHAPALTHLGAHNTHNGFSIDALQWRRHPSSDNILARLESVTMLEEESWTIWDIIGGMGAMSELKHLKVIGLEPRDMAEVIDYITDELPRSLETLVIQTELFDADDVAARVCDALERGATGVSDLGSLRLVNYVEKDALDDDELDTQVAAILNRLAELAYERGVALEVGVAPPREAGVESTVAM